MLTALALALAGLIVSVPPTEPAAEELADIEVAFSEWALDTLGVEVVDPECFIIEAPNVLCVADTVDGRLVGAEAPISASGDFTLDPASEITQDYDTAISDAALECAELAYDDEEEGDDPPRRFFVMDEGHSVLIEDFAEVDSNNRFSAPRVECIAEQLGLPDWLFVEMAMSDVGRIAVPGYTVSWDYSGESYFISSILIYDAEVGGGI